MWLTSRIAEIARTATKRCVAPLTRTSGGLYVARKAQRLLFEHSSITYAQCGEDVIVGFLLGWLNISEPTYLDIGANDPIQYNNTYALYQRGFRGVCVEPNPTLFERLSRV